ncbi:hypothetical protein F7Q89_20530 [Vibrio kanaloae]|nr:hypothetical protein F7Q89_20530 [Vibrio kanaloae]
MFLLRNEPTIPLAILPSSLLRPIFIPKTSNAQLRGEQRLPPNTKHCAINTKFEVEAKMPSVVNPS